MSKMTVRSIVRDRDIWAATTPGRWGWARADRTSGLPPIIHVVVDTIHGTAAMGEQIAIVGEPGVTYQPDARVYDNARFICEAHEALPYYLDRCERLEAELREMAEYIQQHVAAEHGVCSLPEWHNPDDTKRIMELEALVDKLHEHCKTARRLLREMLTTGDLSRCAGCGSCTTRSKCPWLSVYHRALEFLGTGV